MNPTCQYVDLFDQCSCDAIAIVFDTDSDGFSRYCPEHAVMVLCEQHGPAVKAAHIVVNALAARR